MPCSSEHMEPNAKERESKLVSKHLVYVMGELGLAIPGNIRSAARNVYGDTSRIDEHTALLCKLCKEMPEKDAERIIYNARSKDSRRLADWWENHQEVDKKREAEEAETARNAKLREAALAKLTDKEIRALGIKR